MYIERREFVVLEPGEYLVKVESVQQTDGKYGNQLRIMLRVLHAGGELSAGLMAIAGAGWLRMPAQIGARGRGECPKMSHFHGPGAIAKQSGTMAGVL